MSQLADIYPLDNLHDIIRFNKEITAKLNKFQSFPAIFQEIAPDKATMPYIVLTQESDVVEENEVLSKALIAVNIYVNNNRRKAREIASAVKKALSNQLYSTFGDDYEKGSVMTYTRGSFEPSQPDNTIKCNQVKAVLRYNQGAFYFDKN